MASLINKAKEMLTGDKHDEPRDDSYRSHDDKPTSSTERSDISNKLDPRVDSDRDRSQDTSTYGSRDYDDNTTTADRQRSEVGYGADSSVDTDRQRSNVGYDAGSGLGTDRQRSNIGYDADSRLDTDRDDSYRSGRSEGTGGYGTQGGHSTHHTTMIGEALDPHVSSGNTGSHSSNIMNKMDPRVDSDGSRSGITESSGASYGNTSGTRSSDMESGRYGTSDTTDRYGSDTMNRMDPRGDSDRQGGNAYGQ